MRACVCVCVGFVICGCLVVCVLVFTVFCIVCPLFFVLFRFVYVHLFLFFLSVLV